ncbi:unnamed protein product, partial [marine sediment metagenome]
NPRGVIRRIEYRNLCHSTFEIIKSPTNPNVNINRAT